MVKLLLSIEILKLITSQLGIEAEEMLTKQTKPEWRHQQCTDEAKELMTDAT